MLSIAGIGATDVVFGVVAGLTLPAATNYAEAAPPATAMLATAMLAAGFHDPGSRHRPDPATGKQRYRCGQGHATDQT